MPNAAGQGTDQGRASISHILADNSEALVFQGVTDLNGAGNDLANTLVGAFDGEAGRMTLSFGGGVTTLRLDVDGDGKADYMMKINGEVTADSGGWLL